MVVAASLDLALRPGLRREGVEQPGVREGDLSGVGVQVERPAGSQESTASSASHTVTSMPCCCRMRAQVRPAGLAPTTQIRAVLFVIETGRVLTTPGAVHNPGPVDRDRRSQKPIRLEVVARRHHGDLPAETADPRGLRPAAVTRRPGSGGGPATVVRRMGPELLIFFLSRGI